MTYLEKLDLSNNRIEIIESGTFAKLTNMTTLTIKSNNLVKFPHQALSMATRLTNIHLGINKITVLDSPKNTKKFENLQFLDLSYNRIAIIAKDFIDMFPKLTQLSLHRNQLNCGCEHAWLREYKKCLCVFTHGRCRTPRNLYRYTLINFPVHHCPPVRSMQCHSEPTCQISLRTVQPRPSLSGRFRPMSHGAMWGEFIEPTTPDTTTTETTTETLKTSTIITSTQKMHEEVGGGCSSGRSNNKSLLYISIAFVLMRYTCKFLTSEIVPCVQVNHTT